MRLHRIALPFAALIAVMTLAQAAHANVMIIIDKSAQKMTVAVDGEERYVWPVSTGRAGYDTPSGDHQPFRMEKDHYSREWDDAPMPNSIFFTKEGHAIHGTFEVRNLGRPASHGCVRLSTQNAATLYALVKEEGVSHTRVRLIGEIPKGGDEVAGRDRGNGNEQMPRRSYGRYYSTENTYADDGWRRDYQARSGRDMQFGYRPNYYYQQPPNLYYERRYDNGRGFFQPWGR